MDSESCTYRNSMPEIFKSVTAAIGMHVMLIVMERSLWKTKMKFPEAERISFSEEGVNLSGLDDLDEAKADRILNEFILSIIETLSRLVGIQVAQKLIEDLSNDTNIRGV